MKINKDKAKDKKKDKKKDTSDDIKISKRNFKPYLLILLIISFFIFLLISGLKSSNFINYSKSFASDTILFFRSILSHKEAENLEQEEVNVNTLHDNKNVNINHNNISDSAVIELLEIFKDALYNNNAEFLKNKEKLHKIEKTQNCLLGLKITELLKEKVENGYNFDKEINFIKNHTSLNKDNVDKINYTSVVSRGNILNRLQLVSSSFGSQNVNCLPVNEVLGKDTEECNSNRLICKIIEFKKYFGFYKVEKSKDADYISKILSYNLSYKETLLKINKDIVINNVQLEDDIQKVLFILHIIEEAESEFLEYCV